MLQYFLFFNYNQNMIRHIFFDLDSTLYSVRWGLDDFFLSQLRKYVSVFLGLPWEECEPLWRGALERHGTTLEWLIIEKGFTAVDEYFHFLHPENEADCLPPDPELRQFIESLPCPSSVLTNAPSFHAERILKKLELEGIFQQVFAIDSSGVRGKPHPDAFNRALNTFALKPEEVLFIDDIPRYVNGFILMGGKGILLDEMDIHKNYPHEKIRDLRELLNFV
jgi:putative hydrolase of the HAD superfamily